MSIMLIGAMVLGLVVTFPHEPGGVRPPLMLIGAMVLGLIVGVGEVFGVPVETWAPSDLEVPSWLTRASISLGAIAIAGGICTLLRAVLGGALLLFACAANFVLGVVAMIVEGGYGSSLLMPTVLLAVAGGLSLAERERTGRA